MKIGIYAHWRVTWDGTTLRTLGCHARYIRHFLSMTRGVRLFTSGVAQQGSMNTDAICDPHLEVVRVPGGSFASVWMRQRSVRRVLAENLAGLDAVYARVFDPCPWLLAPLCESRGIGLVFDIVGDAIQGIWQHRDWSRMRRVIVRAIFRAEEFLVFRAARRHALLINGGELTRAFGGRHPSPETVISSTLEDDDFYARGDTCQQDTAVVLYAGIIRPAKRLETLIDALGLLLRQGQPVKLRIVGAGDPPSHVASLRNRVILQGLTSVVDFVGYVPLGEALNSEYRSADIYAFPSLTEGAARTLLEAAANSLPMVITDIGSARDLFVDGESALIVPPDDPAAMARALGRMIHDGDLRRRCIRNAYAVVKRHTCREFIRLLVARLSEAAERARRGGSGQ